MKVLRRGETFWVEVLQGTVRLFGWKFLKGGDCLGRSFRGRVRLFGWKFYGASETIWVEVLGEGETIWVDVLGGWDYLGETFKEG